MKKDFLKKLEELLDAVKNGYMLLTDDVKTNAASIGSNAYQLWENSDRNWREQELKNSLDRCRKWYYVSEHYNYMCRLMSKVIGTDSTFLNCENPADPTSIMMQNFAGQWHGIMVWRIRIMKSANYDLEKPELIARFNEVTHNYFQNYKYQRDNDEALLLRNLKAINVTFSKGVAVIYLVYLADPFTRSALAHRMIP